MKVCETCSTWFTEVAESCPACGAGAAAMVAVPSANQKWDRAEIIFLAAVAAIGIAIVAFALWA
jgi:RNA polymerase subunit RPABC4/transcription elongation factor Spt4